MLTKDDVAQFEAELKQAPNEAHLLTILLKFVIDEWHKEND
jgi:hypothetical protein